MSIRSVLVPSLATAALALAATTALPGTLQAVTVLLIAALVGAGRLSRQGAVTGAGLLGLVVLVGTGPASDAGPLALTAWAVATWAVLVPSIAGLGPDRPPPRDVGTRLRTVGGAVAACAAALPLVIVVAAPGRPAAGWAVAGGTAVVVLGILALVSVPAVEHRLYARETSATGSGWSPPKP